MDLCGAVNLGCGCGVFPEGDISRSRCCTWKYLVELMHATYCSQLGSYKELCTFISILGCLSICRQKSHVYPQLIIIGRD